MAVDLWNSSEGHRVRMQCFRRDRREQARCYWCHERIDYTLGPYSRGGDVNAWSPEHLKPRKTWPQLALDPTNIVASHFHCNASRRTKAGIDELGVPSRRW